MEDRKHHPLGFSKWPAFRQCGWYESSDEETEASKQGTAKHDDFADCINEFVTGIPALHESEGARYAASVVHKLSEGNEIHVESYVKIGSANPSGAVIEGEVGIYGYCDAWFVKNDELYVIDFKSGARSNIDYMPQLMGYAYALYASDEDNGLVLNDNIHCIVIYGSSFETVHNVYTYGEVTNNAVVCIGNVMHKDNHEPCVNGMCKYCKHNKECKAMANTIIAFKNNEITNMTDAALYDKLVSVKAAIDMWLDDLKEIAIKNGGVLTDGTVRYEIKTDKHGRMTSVDVAQLWYDMSDKQCSVTQEQLMKSCTISKKAFTDLYKADAKAHGLLVKDVEGIYASRCKYGEPAQRLVKVEAK